VRGQLLRVSGAVHRLLERPLVRGRLPVDVLRAQGPELELARLSRGAGRHGADAGTEPAAESGNTRIVMAPHSAPISSSQANISHHRRPILNPTGRQLCRAHPPPLLSPRPTPPPTHTTTSPP
jgi:hypothetical protein